MIVCAALAALAVSTVQAVEVTSEQAKTAAGNWIRRSPNQSKLNFRSTEAKETLTARDASGCALYHAVNFEGGGFVVTSGDTRLTPVVAFSDTGCYRDGKNNPLYVLLQADRSRAVAAVNGHTSKGTRANDRIAAAESEWKALLSSKRDVGNSSKGSELSISGAYVDKLIKTKWGQSSWDGYDDGTSVFNYSTPNNYVCGCVATVGAQIMRYWQYPTAEIPQFSNTCYVDDSPVTRNSIAGAFNWANMPLSCETTPTPTVAHQKAIGMLMYNVGVAVGMSWHSDSSGASLSALPSALETRFGYKSGGNFVQFNVNLPVGSSTQEEDLKRALYASLDAGMPVCVSVQGVGGHAVIADGYGDFWGTTYTHLNMGWAGIDDAWYDLLDDLPGAGSTYSVIDGLLFNIHPTKKGDVISGRVLSAKYANLAGATVSLYDGSKTLIESTTTSESGVYSFRVAATGTYYLQASYDSVLSEFSEVNMSALSSSGTYGFGGLVGNKWGIVLKVETAIKADAYDSGDSTAAGGTPLTPTDEEQTHGPHTLSETDSQDFFRIEMTPGTKYVFESTGGGYLHGELFSSASADPGSLVAEASYGGVGSNFKIEYFAPSAGTYYLCVSGYGAESVYSLKYSALALSKPSTYLKVEGYYPSVYCTLGPDAVNFMSKIDCDGGWTVSVDDTSWVTLTTDCGVGDGYFRFSLPENTGYDRSCVFTVTAGSLTAYKYLTQFGPLGEKPKEPVLPDAYDTGDDTAAGGTWLTPTKDVQTHGPHVLSTTDTSDFFRISMTAGTTYVFETTGSSDTIGELYNSTSAVSESLVANGDDIDNDGGNFNFRIEYKPSVSQTYYLRVRAYDSSEASYSLKYSCNASATVQHTVTFNANGGNVSPTTRTVESGGAIGSLPTPTRDGWKFSGWFTATTGGTQVTSVTKVTGNVTYYAQWTKKPDPVTPDPVTPDPVKPDPVMPDPDTPDPIGPDVCWEFLNASDIFAPYEAPKTVTLQGAAYNGCDVAGVVELKLGKVNAKKRTSKVSGSVITLDGKKHTITAVTLVGVAGTAPMDVSLTVRDLGTMAVTIGGAEFAGSLGGWHVQSENVGGTWTRSDTRVYVGAASTSLPDEVLADFLPDGEPVIAVGGKWKFAKATSVKWAKPKRGAAAPEMYDPDSGKGLVVDTSSGKTNLSGLKLTYTPKKGTFKGSFKVYALEGEGKTRKIRKYTVKVSGVVVDGIGYGTATCKNPAIAWLVTVE